MYTYLFMPTWLQHLGDTYQAPHPHVVGASSQPYLEQTINAILQVIVLVLRRITLAITRLIGLVDTDHLY